MIEEKDTGLIKEKDTKVTKDTKGFVSSAITFVYTGGPAAA